MMKKADLLSSQVCIKFEIPEEIQRADVFLSPKGEQVRPTDDADDAGLSENIDITDESYKLFFANQTLEFAV